MEDWKKTASLIALVSMIVAACSGAATTTAASGEPTAGSPSAVRLGYFPNVTHAPALVGVADGIFQAELGDLPLEVLTFNAGTEAIEALFAGAIDMTFIGPNPAINAHAQSEGAAIRIVAGSTSGGAALVVKPEVSGPEEMTGLRIATPSLGNTQDVALRAWLQKQGYESDLEGGGDVAVIPQPNSQSLETFISGDIDGAWVPEPWATRLVLEGGGKVLVDERDLWPGGEFVTTHLIVSTDFLETYPDAVTAVLRGLVESIDMINEDADSARETVNARIEELTGSRLADETILGAWSNLTFTLDPIASSLRKSADDAIAVGLLEPVDLTGIYSLEALNGILSIMNRETITS
ncbi:MAG TPA: ABC transporter substrate-binding protein [Acidimicrobiia bacterium]|nr:ABC transporter substrate-binding protein [Acidimicrobiia bacterium]